MPLNSSTSQIDRAADSTSTNPRSDRDNQDVSGGGSIEPDADLRGSSTKASSLMATERNPSTSVVSNEDSRNASVSQQPGPPPKNGRQSSQSHEGLLQIPSNGGAARRPIETTIWDWDTPLESVGESSSYYYEPQGELLHEQRESRIGRSEFTIPHAVSTPSSAAGAHWPFPTSAVGSSSTDVFAVPKRPSGVPPSIAGNKRKSVTDREGSKQPDQKRSSRVMSESGGEDPTSPTDPRPPSQSTRSQTGPNTRLRSGTDTTESRPRLPMSDLEGARPGSGSGQARRTLSEPTIPVILPARKVFPIQIGDKLFRLSGASISSDGESSLKPDFGS